MNDMAKTNRETARKFQNIVIKFGYEDFKLSHAYEILSVLAGYRDWNQASADKADLAAVWSTVKDETISEVDGNKPN